MIHTYFEGNATRCFNKKKKQKKQKQTELFWIVTLLKYMYHSNVKSVVRISEKDVWEHRSTRVENYLKFLQR